MQHCQLFELNSCNLSEERALVEKYRTVWFKSQQEFYQALAQGPSIKSYGKLLHFIHINTSKATTTYGFIVTQTFLCNLSLLGLRQPIWLSVWRMWCLVLYCILFTPPHPSFDHFLNFCSVIINRMLQIQKPHSTFLERRTPFISLCRITYSMCPLDSSTTYSYMMQLLGSSLPYRVSLWFCFWNQI